MMGIFGPAPSGSTWLSGGTSAAPCHGRPARSNARRTDVWERPPDGWLKVMSFATKYICMTILVYYVICICIIYLLHDYRLQHISILNVVWHGP